MADLFSFGQSLSRCLTPLRSVQAKKLHLSEKLANAHTAFTDLPAFLVQK